MMIFVMILQPELSNSFTDDPDWHYVRINGEEHKYFAEDLIWNTPNTAETEVHLIYRLCRKGLENHP